MCKPVKKFAFQTLWVTLVVNHAIRQAAQAHIQPSATRHQQRQPSRHMFKVDSLQVSNMQVECEQRNTHNDRNKITSPSLRSKRHLCAVNWHRQSRTNGTCSDVHTTPSVLRKHPTCCSTEYSFRFSRVGSFKVQVLVCCRTATRNVRGPREISL